MWGLGVDDLFICVIGVGIVEMMINWVCYVFVFELVLECLCDELLIEFNVFVFLSYCGGYLFIEEYCRVFDKGCKVVGIVDLVLYGLRYIMVLLVISVGVNVKVV